MPVLADRPGESIRIEAASRVERYTGRQQHSSGGEAPCSMPPRMNRWQGSALTDRRISQPEGSAADKNHQAEGNQNEGHHDVGPAAQGLGNDGTGGEELALEAPGGGQDERTRSR